jgi:hypothetical protein
MPSWKDEASLVCFIIACMCQSKNEPAKFLDKYHINPCCCNKKLSQGLNLDKY